MAKSNKKTTEPKTIDWNANLASQESFGIPGKTYKAPANAVKTTSLPKENRTKPLAGMQGPSNFKNKSNKEVALFALNALPYNRIVAVGVKAVPPIAKAVKSTGAISRITNTVTSKKVVVSGSPTSGIRSIKPTSGSPGAPNETVAWAYDPSRKGAKQYLTNSVQEYAQGRGSIYVAKTNKTATKFAVGSDKAITKSTKPMKVVKEIRVAGKTQQQIEKEIRIGVREAGSRLKGIGAKGKVKRLKTKAENRKSNKHSPV